MTKLTFLLQELLSWRALLDILLIAAGFFFLYRTLNKLGTWKIVVGILPAFAIFTLASFLNLEGIEWIFHNLSQVAVVALIVIFQPELRKILEKLVSLYRRSDQVDREDLAQLLAESLWQLAGQRRGALLVLPGREPIQEKLAGGHELQAEPSQPLILSIFDPHSPGHDGALVVANNRLTRFGVRLPISKTARLPEEYGTRHHAAMGLAEVTDSLVLVVSEERGRVSAFRDGRMEPISSTSQIAELIREHQLRSGMMAIEHISLTDRSNLMQAASCLVVAALFWVSLASANREIVERSLVAPIEYSSLAEDSVVLEADSSNVTVTVAGPKAEMDEYLLVAPKVHFDLAQTAEGKQTLLIGKENLNLPQRLSLSAAEPQQVEITVARLVERSIAVVPQIVGELPAGLKVKKITAYPETVGVLLPAQKRGIKAPQVTTTPVYLNSIHGSSRLLCKIIAPTHVQPVNKVWPDIEVFVEVQ